MKMEQIECSETSACINQTPRNYPKENTLKTGVDYTMTFSKQVLPEDFVTNFHLRIQHNSDGTNNDTFPVFTVHFSRSPAWRQMARRPERGQMARVTIHLLSPKHKIYV